MPFGGTYNQSLKFFARKKQEKKPKVREETRRKLGFDEEKEQNY